jgi:spermidine/putrescine transport system ATP-binding protein
VVRGFPEGFRQLVTFDASSARGDLILTRITKAYGDFKAVDDLTLIIPKGSFFALLGPSGCGKTTTLRMIAGLEEPTVGSIHLGETDITTTKPYQRPINTVFQNYALFPHLTIFENIAFGLRRRGIKDVDAEVNKVLNLVELPHLAGRKPTQLSGGQQQRIALARAIVNRPALLLLDEPLGALDLKLRRQMQIELKWIQKEVGLTFVHVTHDQEEAMTMADTIAVMNEGQIEQMGSPADLYDNPKTAFVANFLGQSNLIKGTISGNDGDSLIADLYGQKISLPKSRSHATDNSIYAGIRPEKFRISLLNTPVSGNVLSGGHIEDVSYIGVSTQYQVAMPWGQELIVFEQNDDGVAPFKKGDAVNISWEPIFTFALRGDEDVTAGSEVNPEVLDEE